MRICKRVFHALLLKVERWEKIFCWTLRKEALSDLSGSRWVTQAGKLIRIKNFHPHRLRSEQGELQHDKKNTNSTELVCCSNRAWNCQYSHSIWLISHKIFFCTLSLYLYTFDSYSQYYSHIYPLRLRFCCGRCWKQIKNQLNVVFIKLFICLF